MRVVVIFECPVCHEPIRFGSIKKILPLNPSKEKTFEVEYTCTVCGYKDSIFIEFGESKMEVEG